MLAMANDSAPRVSFPAICYTKVTAAFDGGRLTSDGGGLQLAQAERQRGLAEQLAACIADPRDQAPVDCVPPGGVTAGSQGIWALGA